jgi:hypothetical protein
LEFSKSKSQERNLVPNFAFEDFLYLGPKKKPEEFLEKPITIMYLKSLANGQ